MLKNKELYDLILLDEIKAENDDPRVDKVLSNYTNDLTSKFHPEIDGPRYKEALEKFEQNPALRGQFKNRKSDLKSGKVQFLRKATKVRRPQRKRGYHDKGSMAPADEKIRRAIDQREVFPLELMELGQPKLAKWLFSYTPYRRFTEETKNGDVYLWLDELDNVLRELREFEEYGPFIFELSQYFGTVIEEYPQKEIRKYFTR